MAEMSNHMQIKELFRQEVTRDIPPVVYFHEQTPEKVADEVSEYIVTGGWNENHPNYKRVPDGIHEQYVRLLNGISKELDKNGGPSLPAAWISGFYGSGKSSFAKLLGLALDGMEFSNGKTLAEELLNRDMTDRAQEFRDAWKNLRQKVAEPFSVVFDIGGFARDNEHIHSAAVRQVQKRLGYCPDHLVADFELRLEQAGEWDRFLKVSEDIGHPWQEEKHKPLADETFSEILHNFDRDRYTDPMSWIDSRVGTTIADSAAEAVTAISEMMRLRKPNGTLFIVVDEISQYVLANEQRVDKLRAMASELGSQLKGKAWLLALGQQKIDKEAGDAFLVWAKDRFPSQLRVHLAATNIRDVVHRRLLQKDSAGEEELRKRFDKCRPDLKLFAFGCEDVSPDEFVEVYPLLPGQIDLLLQITSAMRIRSARAQGDDQAIRGLLQLLGELFRDQKLAELPVGTLITLDKIYEVQKTALDSDTQASMARLLNETADKDPMLQKAAKTVALLELIQDTRPTDAKLVAQCLYDKMNRGNQVTEVTDALEELRNLNLVAFSEKLGYRIQSTAGEEWEREKRDVRASREAISEIVRDALKNVMDTKPEKPVFKNRPFPWAVMFSDGRGMNDEKLIKAKDDAVVTVDFRFVQADDRAESTWVERSRESNLRDRLIWVCGDISELTDKARALARARGMVKKFSPRRGSLSEPRKQLLQQEEVKVESLEDEIQDVVESAWMSGTIYFREKSYKPDDFGNKFAVAVLKVAERIMSILFEHFDSITIQPSELEQLLLTELTGPSTKFLKDELGILELDSGKYQPTCSGVIPVRIRDHIESEDGVSGSNLLAKFGGPPYAYQAEVIKACVLGLLRGSKLKIEDESENEITAVRDAGVREVFDRITSFKRAQFIPVGDDDIGVKARSRICKFFDVQLGDPLDREDNAIADAVEKHFRNVASRLRDVLKQLDRLPGQRDTPQELTRLNDALEHCLAKVRQTKPTVQRVKKKLEHLIDGVKMLNELSAELHEDAVQLLREASDVSENHAGQLREIDALSGDAITAADSITEQLNTRRPWIDAVAVKPHLETVVEAYTTERKRLLEWQEQQAEHVRSRVTMRDGYSTLSTDKAHKVLRPINDAPTDTTADAVAPTLRDLKDPFINRLREAEETANHLLDVFQNEGGGTGIVPVKLELHNREIRTEEDVETLVVEIRDRLLEQVRNGQRVRLI